jgi:DNA-binding response OmpR family regulator
MIGTEMKVLIVEDDVTIADMYKFKCELSGMNVKHGHNGLEALAILEDFVPDTVLLDLQMPEMNGEQFLAAFRDMPQFVQTPVLILTNMGESEVPKGIMKLGVSDVIVKSNCTPAEVIERIRATSIINAQPRTT